ncbi:cobalamin biosynthesis protein [bacterium]|nr:cobalamin biosynthesis protein [bacterium]
MSLAIITLSEQGARLAARLAAGLPESTVYVHRSVDALPDAVRFDRVVALTADIFGTHRGLVYIAPCGVVVRAVAKCLEHKTTDPAVVVVDVGGRWAVSLLSGHEGGANDLAVAVANILGAEPVVSTTTEAAKSLIVGVGCRRGVSAEEVEDAVRTALAGAGLSLDDVRLLASVDIKNDEAGLIEAARSLGVPLRFIGSEEIRSALGGFTRSDFVMEKVNVPAVAEPAALLAGRRTQLVLQKTIVGPVTVAAAREDCS